MEGGNEVREVINCFTLAAEASENLFRRKARLNSWFADILSAKNKLFLKIMTISLAIY